MFSSEKPSRSTRTSALLSITESELSTSSTEVRSEAVMESARVSLV